MLSWANRDFLGLVVLADRLVGLPPLRFRVCLGRLEDQLVDDAGGDASQDGAEPVHLWGSSVAVNVVVFPRLVGPV